MIRHTQLTKASARRSNIGSRNLLSELLDSAPEPDETTRRAFNRGVLAIMRSLKDGEISEEQASLLISARTSTFVEATINEQFMRFWKRTRKSLTEDVPSQIEQGFQRHG
jgi:hypothetical protein